jgi:GT2 family glycosyltransferase/glycosyltransferase involved in cell wall biosynthesis
VPQSPIAPALLRTVEDSKLFDAEWYTSSNPDVRLSGMSAAEHFLRIGLRLQRAPGPRASLKEYLTRYPAVARSARSDKPAPDVVPVPGPVPAPVAARRSDPDLVSGPVSETVLPIRRRVDVVVPVHNALEDVKLCLHALARCETGFDQQIIVINDGSDPETTRWLRQACAALDTPQVQFHLIDHKGNKGYTKAVNTGLRHSDAPFVVTLNSDTIVTPFWLDGLVRCMESDPAIGITGPMSNAASWQNVPDLLDDKKKFAVNALPTGLSPEAMAGIVRRASARTYPRAPFVNGFCFMLRREVIDKIGHLDEKAFPRGYGEENDLCIRARDAGFALAYADDTYVYHAKSKSFGSAQRDKLSKAGTLALKTKHSEAKFDALLRQVRDTTAMDAVRARVRDRMQAEHKARVAAGPEAVLSQKVLFLLPVRGGGGGAHSVIQEVTAMRRMGVEARVAVRDKHLDDYHELYGDIPEVTDLFLGFGPSNLTALAAGYDLLVGTIFTSVEMVRDVVAACPWVHPAYYAQDYEPLFFDKTDPMYDQAMQSYGLIPGMLIFAKTHWIGRTIHDNHGVAVEKVWPSIDHQIYHPGTTPRAGDGPLVITAMIRPRTPRRGAGRTMELLAGIHARYGDRVSIRIFGCEDDSPEFAELPRDFPHENKGILTRPQVAALLREADMFIDMSDYQAFGRTGLEAMACGTIAVVPQAGGGDEYAIDGENALVVDTMDVPASLNRIAALLDDPAAAAPMQMAALATAAAYSPRRAALSELIVMARARAARQ